MPLDEMKCRRENDEVWVAQADVTCVTRLDVERLKADSRRNARGRVRLCAHRTTEDAVHEMVIVHRKGGYVRPHRHSNKSESFHVIEGELDVVLFDEEGEVTDVIAMGPYRTGKCFYYRLDSRRYHTVIPMSGQVVFHETTRGPFRRHQADFAPWAPSQEDVDAVTTYLDRLLREACRFRGESPEARPADHDRGQTIHVVHNRP